MHNIASYVRKCSLFPSMLSDAQRVELWQHSRSFLRQYGQLAYLNQLAGIALYKMRPKWHAMRHIMLALAEGDKENPKIREVWGEESLGGAITRITRRCHSTTAMKPSCERVIGSLMLDVNGPIGF